MIIFQQTRGQRMGVRSLPPARWDPATTAHPVTIMADYAGKTRCHMPTGWTAQSVHIRSKSSFSTGKWYWEVRATDVVNGFTGTTGCGLEKAGAGGFLGFDSNALGYWPQGSLFFGGSAIVTGMATIADGDVLMFAWDADIGSLWVGKNGTWHGSGNPGAGTGATTTGKSTTGTTWWPAITPWSSSSETVKYDLIAESARVHSLPSGFSYITGG